MDRPAPFSRARAFFAQVAAIMSNPLLAAITKQLAVEALGPYRSRGKGKGRSKWRALRHSGRSKYQPHQGSQERIRRVLGGWHTQAPLTKARILAAAPAPTILETLLRSYAK